MKVKNICVLGGTGFVGTHLINKLTGDGKRIRVLSRHPQRARHIQVNPGVELIQADVHDPAQLREAFEGMDAVINLVGILNQSANSTNTFREVHVELPRKVTEACLKTGVRRLLHMSALKADTARGSSEYLRSKGEGENRAHVTASASVHVTTFQPSVIFGPGDSFFNRFANLLKMTPVMFPLACPNSRFAPVYVGDVAQAFAKALEDNETWGKTFQLCGPETFTLRELVGYCAKQIGACRMIVGLGGGLSRLQARILGLMPGKPFSMDNYQSLQVDSVCDKNGFEALGITPTRVDAVVPMYLGGESYRQRYFRFRRGAGR